MKKNFLLILGLLFLALPAAVRAQFSYSTNADNTLTVIGYSGPGGNVVVPANSSGLAVSAIGYRAFYDASNLTSIVIPDGVTNIGGNAFLLCTNMTNATIPGSLETIGGNAFENCTNLTGITIPGNVSSIANYSFLDCYNLATLTISNGPTNIGQMAFNDCYKLGQVTIPDSVTTVGFEAFYRCTNLTNITFGNGLTNIGSQAFGDCTTLISFDVDSNNPAFKSVGGVLLDSSQTTLIQYPAGRTGNYAIANGILSLASSAFANSSLSSIAIPQSLTNIGLSAFLDCTNLTAINADTNNPVFSSVGGVLFNHNRTVLVQCPGGLAGSYVIPNGVTSIATNAFIHCTSLTSVTIPASVTNIGYQAFHSCSHLKNFYFQGNAPGGLAAAFPDDYATVYYLPGTTGWASEEGGLPTMAWNPTVQPSGAGFGMQGNQFGFNITGATNLTVAVQVCCSPGGAWTTLTNVTLTNGLYYFSEPCLANAPARFYRISTP